MTNPTLTSWSESDLIEYDRNNWAERDPLLHYAAGDGQPLGWGTLDWSGNPQDEDYVRYLHEAGLQGGVTVPLSTPSGPLGAMTVLSASRSNFSPQCIQAIEIIGRVAMIQANALGLEKHQIPLAPDLLSTLSQHQADILEWAAQGKSSQDIATIMGKKKRGIDYNISEILKKFNVSSRAQAIAIYIDLKRNS